jgi:hypothetical protein
MGDPQGVLPGVVAVELVLGRDAHTAVFVGSLEVYPARVEFTVRMITASRDWLPGPPRGPRPPTDPAGRGGSQEPGPGAGLRSALESLQLVVEFSDGRKAVSVGRSAPSDELERVGPVLWAGGRSGGGSIGGGTSWFQGFSLWPLPPPGPLRFVCEWPAAGLAVSHAEIDAQPVLDAAARARVVFGVAESEHE